ncbi:MAG: YbaN family protein [Deltaproteobacteria bacterium]|nr:YbaN family protein [Deltaproteobacteria bacterium]
MKILYLTVGFISLCLGIIGIFLPILPTTPFLLLSGFCFAKSSDKMHNWLMTNRYFGRYISDYRSGLGIPLKIKIYSISLLWITILSSSIFFIANIALKIFLIVIAIIVTIHIVSVKTR